MIYTLQNQFGSAIYIVQIDFFWLYIYQIGYFVLEWLWAKEGEMMQLPEKIKRRYSERLYPFQNEIWISNRDGSIFLYVTKAIWKVLGPGFILEWVYMGPQCC